MQTKRCPHCGREYVDDGIVTLCPGCQRDLQPRPPAQPPPPQALPPPGVLPPPPRPGAPVPAPPPPMAAVPPALSAGPPQQALNLAYWAIGLGVGGLLGCNVMSPVALFLGIKSNKEGGGGMAVAGIVLGAIGTLSLILSIIVAIVYCGMIMAWLGLGGMGGGGVGGGATP